MDWKIQNIGTNHEEYLMLRINAEHPYLIKQKKKKDGKRPMSDLEYFTQEKCKHCFLFVTEFYFFAFYCIGYS